MTPSDRDRALRFALSRVSGGGRGVRRIREEVRGRVLVVPEVRSATGVLESLAGGDLDLGLVCGARLGPDLPAGLRIAAVLERGDPRDVLLTAPVLEADGLADLPAGTAVAVPDAYRLALLAASRTGVEPVRAGDVEDALERLRAGRVDAAILSGGDAREEPRAGRGGWMERESWVPPAGQGVPVLLARTGTDVPGAEVLEHPPTRLAFAVERAVAALLSPAQRVRLGVLATVWGDGFRARAVVVGAGGRRLVRASVSGHAGTVSDDARRLVALLERRGLALVDDAA